MTRQDILILAIRIGALWLVYLAISMLTVAVLTVNSEGAPLIFMLMVFLIGLGVIAWKFSDAFAHKLLPEHVPGAPVTPWRRDDAQDMLLRVVGVVFATSSVGRIVAIWIKGAADLTSGHTTKLAIKADLAQQGVYLVVGAGLILGPAGLKRLWERLSDLSGNRNDEVGEAEVEGEPTETEPGTVGPP